jgi:hypothetical protein
VTVRQQAHHDQLEDRAFADHRPLDLVQDARRRRRDFKRVQIDSSAFTMPSISRRLIAGRR